MVSAMFKESYGLYLHIPFCRRRCTYCDFFSTEGKQSLLRAYVQMLAREMVWTGEAGGRPSVGSVYFGGGTPSLLKPEQITALMENIRSSFRLDDDAEITLEANPGTLDGRRVAGYRKAGVNRLSLGVQSMEDDELRLLGRIHTRAEAVQTYQAARRAGWKNISVDLIFGLPGQTVETWERTLNRTLALAPEHLSLYALTLERGTKLARAVRRGELPAPEEDAAAEMYECAEALLAGAGYRHYEISNWARGESAGLAEGPSRFPRFACRHNLRYWQNQPYLGFGAGAHGCTAGKRYANIRSVEKYLERMGTGRARRFPLSPAESRSALRALDEEMRETMWLGLRLTEAGVDRERYQNRFQEDYYGRFRKEIDASIADGLLEWTKNGDALRLTTRGRLLGNRVFQLFV